MTSAELDALERSSFNSFDPEGFDEFDPEGFKKRAPQGAQRPVAGKIGKLQAQFDITVTSTCTTNSTKVELFQKFRSMADSANAQVSALNPASMDSLIAALNSAGAGTATAGTTWSHDRLYFDVNGNLVYNDFTNGGGLVTISCRQVPYRALLESSAVQPFTCEKIRMTVAIDAQIDNQLVHVTNTFLGSQKRNNISPRSFFRPDQFQGLIIDLPTKFQIDGEKGLEYIMNNKTGVPNSGNNVVTFNMFLSRYVKQQIAS